MAAFSDDKWKDESQRLDYRLMQNGPVVLYHRRELLEQDAEWLLANDYRIDRIDASRWQSEQGALDSLARSLEFPDHFGRNVNALNDCLGDIAISEQGGRALILEKYDAALRRLGSFAWNVLDVFAGRSRGHLLWGRRLIGIIQSDDPRLELAPVGASPVTWNHREWLNKNRGL
jgi:Barstar (barnase inhibitor)